MATAKFVSQRRDGRGHWPAGKRRSSIDPRLRRQLLARVRVQLDRGKSPRSVAERIRVDVSTLHRWLAGDDFPMPASAAKLRRLPPVVIG